MKTTTFNDSDIGRYEVIAGRRILLSPREQMIRQLEEIAYARAEYHNRAYYVVENSYGKLYVTEDPGKLLIVRVCRPASSTKRTNFQS